MNADAPLDTQTLHDQHGRWPQADSVEDFRLNLSARHARIASACQRVGRDPASVRLLPVSKTKTEASIRLAYAAGCRLLGENKAQEDYRKWEEMADIPGLRWSAFSALRVRGFMTLALFSAEAERVRRCFVLLRELCDRLRQDVPQGIALDELSMGMSGDYEITIEEGATIVRVGQAIFGARDKPDTHY